MPATFLPRSVDEPQPAADSAPRAARPRILVADDTHVGRLFVSRLLERLGFDVATVSDGAAAVASARAERFDLVLMDVHMPIMNGLCATRTLRAAGVRTPVLALTASMAPEDSQMCLDAGMDGCLHKPLDPGAFEAEWRRARSAAGES